MIESQNTQGVAGNLSDDQASNVSRGSLGSLETLQKYKDINWDLVYSSYSSMYKTGYKEMMLESNFNKKWEVMQKTFSGEAGKELGKLYDAHNSMLQEWLHNPKDIKNFNDKFVISIFYWNHCCMVV